MRKILVVAAAAGLLFGTPALCVAQGAQDSAPGQKMQDKESVRGQPAPPATLPVKWTGSRSGGTNPGTSKTR